MELAIVFILVLARILAVVFTAPLLGNKVVGVLPKLGIAVGVSLIAMPIVDRTIAASMPLSEIGWTWLISAIFAEAVLGALIGLGAMILFVAAQMVGTIIGQMAGIPIGDSADQAAVPGVGNLFGLLSLAVFALMADRNW